MSLTAVQPWTFLGARNYVNDSSLKLDLEGYAAVSGAPGVNGVNGVWNDLKGVNNFTLTLMASTSASGWAGNGSVGSPYGVQFDGVNDYTIKSSPTGLGISTGTLEVWFMMDPAGIGAQRAMCGLNTNYVLAVDAFGHLEYEDFGAGLPRTSGTLVGDGNVHHVVFTFNSGGNVGKLYLDGTLILTSLFTLGAGASYVSMGNVGIGSTWMGRIMAMRIYDKQLSTSEIAQNFAAGCI